MVYREAFLEIQSKFGQLFREVCMIVEEAELSVVDLKKVLDSYPIMETPLQDANTIKEVMTVVRNNSSFINCFHLKEVADYFQLSQAREKVDAYCKLVDEFCLHKLTQHSYVRSFLEQPRHLLSTETITLKLEWNPDEKTLSNIQEIIRNTFKHLASHIHVVVVSEGSVTVICYAPQYLMGALVRLAQENMKVLVEDGVTYLSVGHTVVLDTSVQKQVGNCLHS